MLAPLDGDAAAALFVDRARVAEPGLELGEAGLLAVAEICSRSTASRWRSSWPRRGRSSSPPRRCAPAWISVSSCSTAGPRDLPTRQRALRDTLDWSFELLEPDEQRLFARLGVFAGGFTLESAEAVCAATLDDVASLVDNSLVRRVGERFTMLETILEYARQKLADERRRGRRRAARTPPTTSPSRRRRCRS